jgi:hypothetical protein
MTLRLLMAVGIVMIAFGLFATVGMPLLMRWPCQRIEDSSLRQSFTRRENTFCQAVGNLRFPMTVTYP